MDDTDQFSHSNRSKKLRGRAKRRRYLQGTRAFTHAMTNRIAKQAGVARRKPKRSSQADDR